MTESPALTLRACVARAILLLDAAHLYGEVFGDEKLADELADDATRLLATVVAS